MVFQLTDPINSIPGIGEKYHQLLQNLNINTIYDLLNHYPTRYEDWSQQSPLSQVQPGEKITVQAQLISITNIITKTGKKIQKAQVTDGQSTLQVIWFNQTYLLTSLRAGTWLSLSGKVDKFGPQLSFISPRFEKIIPPSSQDNPSPTLHTGKLIAIYPETAGLSSNWLRAKIKYILDNIAQLPDWRDNLKKTHIPKQLTYHQAIHAIHFPTSIDNYIAAQTRLGDDELISMHFESLLHRQQWQTQSQSYSIQNTQGLNQFIKSLPFTLTQAQNQAIQTITQDLAKNHSANRLIQGDVGSGKTVVAAAAAFLTSKSGYQTAIMAPTEILANQHYEVFQKLLTPHNIAVALQTGRSKHVKTGQDDPFDVLIGTHALLSDIVNFDKLALVIIDEQHRFGRI